MIPSFSCTRFNRHLPYLRRVSDYRLSLSCRLNTLAGGRAPLDLLRPIIFGLQNDDHLHALFQRLLEVLNAPIPMLLPETYSEARELTPELKNELRDNIGKHLLGSRCLSALRLKLSLADYLWVT